MKKLKTVTIILVASGLFLIATAVLMQLFTPAAHLRHGASAQTKYFKNVRDIVVISGSLPIELSYTEEESCIVTGLSELPLIMNYSETGELRITQDDSFTLSLFSKSSENYRISVQVPRKSYGRISLSSSGGSITSEAISCETFEVSTKNGDINISGADERTKIKTVGGNITLSLTSLNGDMTINGGKGDIDLTIPEKLSYFLEYGTENGHCTTAGFPEDITEKKGDIALLSGKGGVTLKINTTDGNLKITRLK